MVGSTPNNGTKGRMPLVCAPLRVLQYFLRVLLSIFIRIAKLPILRLNQAPKKHEEASVLFKRSRDMGVTLGPRSRD